MKHNFFLLLFTGIFFTCIFNTAHAQNVIDWQPDYQLQLSDFQSSATHIGNGNTFSLHSSATMSFLFSMSNYEFMFTKNFNSKVSCTFVKNAAVLIAPDSAIAKQLISFAQYDFDLTELYARNFRKALYDKKGAFSSAKFFQPVYDTLQQQYAAKEAEAGRLTNYGQDSVKLTSLHNEVLAEIDSLSNFCKACNPKKNKKAGAAF